VLAQLLADQTWNYAIVFVRLGAAFAVMPGFAEVFVPARVRLALALVVTLVVTPVIATRLPGLPVEPGALALLVILEAIVGLFIGLIARFTMAAAHVAGMIIGFQTSLASALVFDPGSQQQGIITSAWMSTIAIVALLAADLHHVLLRALADSYVMFPAGAPPQAGEFADAAGRLMSQSFNIGVRMAMPFLIYGIVLFAALGLAQRLMPQIQIFFIAMPLQLGLGLILLAATVVVAVHLFIDEVETRLEPLIVQR
jgi:flagellar biosynthetic protein FliR